MKDLLPFLTLQEFQLSYSFLSFSKKLNNLLLFFGLYYLVIFVDN